MTLDQYTAPMPAHDNPVATHVIIIVLIPHVVDDEVGPIHSRLQLIEELLLGLLRAGRGLAYGHRSQWG